MSELTAIDWLVKQLNNMSWGHIAIDVPKEMIEQAKEMERQQIVYSFNEGRGGKLILGNNYYNETFKKD